MNAILKDVDWKELGTLLAIVVAIMFLWSTWLVYPLKILVVFFHELSHGLMAVLTGGSIQEIRVVAAEGGHCITRGGSVFLTLSAGYLGSLVCGGIILVLATRTRYDQTVAMSVGAIIVLVTLVFVRPVASFGFLFGLVSGASMIAAGHYLPEQVNDYLLKVVGLTSCLYAVLDIKSDILDRPKLPSDARMLAQLTGLPTLFWGLFWILVAMAGSLFFLLMACKSKTGTSSLG